MNIYADTSALVKRYINERGSHEFVEFLATATTVATCLITRAEMAAAFARTVRKGMLSEKVAHRLLATFRAEWPSLTALHVLDVVASQADNYAWDYGLRGYDAIHLASVLTWQEAIKSKVVLATYDHELWSVAQRVGLTVFPADLTPFIKHTSRRN